MKTLQSNFTTPEQSKKLLELGVPEDSADCYYRHDFINDPTPCLYVLQPQWDETIGKIRGKTGQKIDPCWSVGRLVEIILKCYISCYEIKFSTAEYYTCTLSNINIIIMKIEHLIKYNNLDFSKLEE